MHQADYSSDSDAHTLLNVCILWDVDGVLIDSAEQHRASWRQLAEEQGFPYSDASFWAHFGRRNADVIPAMFGVAGPPERIAALADRKEEIYRALLAKEAVALPGACELMAALHAAGYRQALGSSAPAENIALIVTLLGLAPYLTAWVSGESVAHGKPAPDLFLAAAARCGVPPERCLVIEDAPAGIQAAHAGGMRALAVRRAGVADAPGLDAAEYVADTLLEVDVPLVDRLLGAYTLEEARTMEPMSLLVGQMLESVTFTAYYPQLRFHDALLNTENPTRIQVGQNTYQWGEPGYRDALCGRIGRIVHKAEEVPSKALRIEFSDGAIFSMTLGAEETEGLEVAELVLMRGAHSVQWIWRDDEKLIF